MMQSRGGSKVRLVIAAVIALFSVISYYRLSQPNPITGRAQHISTSPQEEVALGLQAAPEMAAQFGGEDPDPKAQALVDEIGGEIVRNSVASKTNWRWDFHALADHNTVNAFALPGGQVFITHGLLRHLESRGQLAGVLGHEIGHVLARHSAEQMAKARLTQGLGAAGTIAVTDPNDPGTYRNGAIAQMVTQLVSLRFSRQDELEADQLGVRLLSEAGYDPRAMIRVMEILKKAGGSRGGPEFFQTHPNPENRITKIQQAIKDRFPNGVPAGMKP
jgi:predicted Zn-dependent protease